ncbi:MAG: energy-coupling factor transporter ATPase [Clostridia bacterium]|nr:energy-coupling factor transporter ATPase [Clostridia bacterium]
MYAIELKNISYTYSRSTPFERLALDDVSLSIKSGVITGLMGHTGSGKSTLVRLFNGLERPDSGEVMVFGENIWEKPKEITKYRFKVGLVFQYPEYQLFEETVMADIAYGPKNMGLDNSEIEKRIKQAADLCRIDSSLLEKSPFDLSGGQKRRVAIAGIMAMRPEILVLDEPAAGLDPRGREEIFDGIRDYKDATGATVIIVSHSMEDMAKYSDEIVVMNKGKIYMHDTKSEVFKHSHELCNIGLDIPPIAYFAKELSNKGLDLPEGLYSVEDCVKSLDTIFKSKV